jgi:glycosyltransferase involved in cell wall biosynthesis
VQRSAAEFSVAQPLYVGSRCGWFSDRSVRYLAAGKPVVLQDTGFSQNLPVGEGLLAFATIDEAADAVDDVASNYAEHSRAARRLAEEHFDADVVLSQFADEVGACSR